MEIIFTLVLLFVLIFTINAQTSSGALFKDSNNNSRYNGEVVKLEKIQVEEIRKVSSKL